MLKPYFALALQAGWPCIRNREDIAKVAIPHLSEIADFSILEANWELPVRLVAFPESAFEGWAAEFGMGHVEFCKKMLRLWHKTQLRNV